MKSKEKIKRFWTLDVHNHEGFTLVELIIVIAILAILSSVAVVGYSSYVEKANKQADMTLVEEIKNALLLYYYSNSATATSDYVILKLDNDAEAGTAFAAAAMEAAYGTNWQTTLKLQYSGWSATFQASNFYGSESGLKELLSTVEGLTDALGGALANDSLASAMGEGFKDYTNKMGADDSAEMADAAVFYVADKTAGLTSEQIARLSSPAVIGDYNQMNAITGSTLSSTAVMYALAEGYARFCEGKKVNGPREILNQANADINEKASGGDALDAKFAFDILQEAFGKMSSGEYETYADEYMNGSYLAQDLQAYAEAMRTVSTYKESIISNNEGKVLGSEGYFTSSFIQGLLEAYAEGGILIRVYEEDGVVKVVSNIDEV